MRPLLGNRLAEFFAGRKAHALLGWHLNLGTGLRIDAVRAALVLTAKLPKPTMRTSSPAFSASRIASSVALTTSAVSLLLLPVLFANRDTTSVLPIAAMWTSSSNANNRVLPCGHSSLHRTNPLLERVPPGTIARAWADGKQRNTRASALECPLAPALEELRCAKPARPKPACSRLSISRTLTKSQWRLAPSMCSSSTMELPTSPAALWG